MDLIDQTRAQHMGPLHDNDPTFLSVYHNEIFAMLVEKQPSSICHSC
jgi:hypothetical protein